MTLKAVFLFLFTYSIFPQETAVEELYSFRHEPGIKVTIAAPQIDTSKPTGLILYALPNGNSTEWTIGKVLTPGDDWHFGIQNIGAQSKFLRGIIKEYNIVVVYLETDQKSWPAWKAANVNYASIVNELVDKIRQRFSASNPFVVLSGHSGGGRFIFSYLDAHENIPAYVKRICFLDSNYGYEPVYGEKITRWLKSSEENYLSVLAYNDSTVILNGKNIVSPTGGTWYRSRMMLADLGKEFSFTITETDTLITSRALNGRINITLHNNPRNEILHTVQVERNGFIHSMLTGTVYEEKGYFYFGRRVYDGLMEQ